MSDALFKKARFRIAGDTGLLVELGEGVDPAVNAKVWAMVAALSDPMPNGILQIVPTYRSLLLVYDPGKTHPEQVRGVVETVESKLETLDSTPEKIVEIPVCYGGKLGPDIEHVAETNNLTVDEVIQIHSDKDYLIYMVAFTPGFPFLGGLDPRLSTPRLTSPRTRVPEGSVALANNQTGIYPIASPGGWQLIGRSPLRLFRPEKAKPFLYQAGDRIRFCPINQDEYEQLLEKETIA